MTATERAWAEVGRHAERLRGLHLRDLFADDPERSARYQAEAAGLWVDYSKNRFDAQALASLIDLARRCDLEAEIEALFEGEIVNATEGRAAMHPALRYAGERAFPSTADPGADVMPAVRAVREQMREFCRAVHEGEWTGASGEPIREVVNIGIGGSDLGPMLVCDALRNHAHPRVRTHFVSNLDASALQWTLEGLSPAHTLFVIASKTFGTQETLRNAYSARQWVVEALGEAAVERHFVAVSTHTERVREFGIDPDNMFAFWDWVGGRYSLWSSIGLSIALGLSYDTFEQLHAGAASMDEHFRSAPLDRNLPVIMALLQVWYRNGFDAETRAILPYDFALRRLPEYLQQLEMESLGKGVTRAGLRLERASCPILWGGPGNNGQHAFYQFLHQGSILVPSDFIVAARAQHDRPEHQFGVLANALAQTEALMRGRTLAEAEQALSLRGAQSPELAPHLVMSGNQPSTTVVYECLTPSILGALIALYEHKVFVHSVLLDINAFDQFGVELGKVLASALEPELRGEVAPQEHDASTQALVARLRRLRAAT